MGKRKLQILAAVCLCLCLVVAVSWLAAQPNSDDARYRDLSRSRRLFALTVSAEKGFLGVLFRPLRLSDRYVKRFDARRDQLLECGYLTNVCITVTNANSRRVQVIGRLESAAKGTDTLICKLSWSSNSVVIVCRPQDVPCLRRALAAC